MLRDRRKCGQDFVRDEVVCFDKRIDCGLSNGFFGHTGAVEGDNHHFRAHLHIIAGRPFSQGIPRQYCADLQFPYVGPNAHQEFRGDAFKLQPFQPIGCKGNSTMFIPIIDGLNYRKKFASATLFTVIRLEAVNKRDCGFWQLNESSLRTFPVCAGAANRKFDLLLFLAGKWLDSAFKRDVVKSCSKTMGGISNCKDGLDWWFRKGGKFYDVPPLSVHFDGNGIEVVRNKPANDFLGISEVIVCPPEFQASR